MIGSDQRYRIPSGVVARQLSGETVILNLESGTYFGLNPVGTRVWQLLEDGRSLSEIVTALVGEYEVTASHAEADTLRIAGELQAAGLIECA